jgi:folate-dependent phosphoribosylglycinamide formyltransferase PurN
MLRVAVLCSQRAPGLVETLFNHIPRGTLYDVVAVLTSEAECVESAALHSLGIPVLRHDINEFYRTHGTRLADLEARRVYDADTLSLLAPHRPELIVCCGYLYVLTRTFLDAYPQPIVNLHHSDLLDARPDNSPKYPTLHAVRDAIFAGEKETRSTVHVVTAAVDAGPPLVRSWAFPVAPLVASARALGAIDILKAYAYAHENWMLRTAWPALLRTTFELFAHNRVARHAADVTIDGRPAVLELDSAGNTTLVPCGSAAIAGVGGARS